MIESLGQIALKIHDVKTGLDAAWKAAKNRQWDTAGAAVTYMNNIVKDIQHDIDMALDDCQFHEQHDKNMAQLLKESELQRMHNEIDRDLEA